MLDETVLPLASYHKEPFHKTDLYRQDFDQTQ